MTSEGNARANVWLWGVESNHPGGSGASPA
jgi:hypothetical protein